MQQRIIDAIGIALNSLFPEIPILDVETEQDVKRPAFFVTCIQSQLIERIKHAGFFMVYSFDILFDPGNEAPELDCRKMESELMLLLRRIEDPESVYAFRPFDIHFETVDGTLHALFQIEEAIKPEREKEDTVQKFNSYSRIKN